MPHVGIVIERILVPVLLVPFVLRVADLQVHVPVAVKIAAWAGEGARRAEHRRVCVDPHQIWDLGHDIVASLGVVLQLLEQAGVELAGECRGGDEQKTVRAEALHVLVLEQREPVGRDGGLLGELAERAALGAGGGGQGTDSMADLVQPPGRRQCGVHGLVRARGGGMHPGWATHHTREAAEPEGIGHKKSFCSTAVNTRVAKNQSTSIGVHKCNFKIPPGHILTFRFSSRFW